MRIAVMIIALCLVMVIGLESCSAVVGGNLGNNAGLSGAGAAGLFVAFLFILGAAFALGAPKVSMFIFIIAALLGFYIGMKSAFFDMTVWGWVAVFLAVMSYDGIRELKKLESKKA